MALPIEYLIPKYKSIFVNHYNNYFTLAIFEDGFNGTTTDVTLNGVSLEFIDNETIPTTLLNFKLVTTNGNYFDDLFTGDIYKYRVCLYYGIVNNFDSSDYPFFTGYLRTETYKRNIDKTITSVEFVAYDEISILKRIEFKKSDGTAFNGLISILDILKEAFKTVKSNCYGITLFEDAQPANITTTTTYLEKLYINADVLTDYNKKNITYYEALEKVLCGYKLAVSAEFLTVWVVYSKYAAKQQITGKTYKYVKGANTFIFVGNKANKLKDFPSDNYLITYNKIIEKLPAYNSVYANIKAKYDTNLIKRNDISLNEDSLNLYSTTDKVYIGNSSYNYKLKKYTNSKYWELGTAGGKGYLVNKIGTGSNNSSLNEWYLSYRYLNNSDAYYGYQNKYLIGKYKYKTPYVIGDVQNNGYYFKINVKSKIITRDFPELEPYHPIYPTIGKFYRYLLMYSFKVGNKYWDKNNKTWSSSIVYNYMEFAVEKNKSNEPLNEKVVENIDKLIEHYPPVTSELNGEVEIAFYNGIYAYYINDNNYYVDLREAVKEVQIHSVEVNICSNTTYKAGGVYYPDTSKTLAEFSSIGHNAIEYKIVGYIDDIWLNKLEVKQEFVSNEQFLPVAGNSFLYNDNGVYKNAIYFNIAGLNNLTIEKVVFWKLLNDSYKNKDKLTANFFYKNYENDFFFPYALYTDGTKYFVLEKYKYNIDEANGTFVLTEVNNFDKTI